MQRNKSLKGLQKHDGKKLLNEPRSGSAMEKLLTTNVSQKRSHQQLLGVDHKESSPLHKGIRSAKNSMQMSVSHNIGKIEAVIEKNKALIEKHHEKGSPSSNVEHRATQRSDGQRLRTHASPG